MNFKPLKLSACAVIVAMTLAGCTCKQTADDNGRIRVIQSQSQMDALLGFDGEWNSATATGFLSGDVREWRAADTGLPFDGVIIASGANVKVCLPGEIQKEKNTFYIPAGKFVLVQKGGMLQVHSGLNKKDFDHTTLIVGGTGTSNTSVSKAPTDKDAKNAGSIFNPNYTHALEIQEGGTFILGSDKADAKNTKGPDAKKLGEADNAVLWLADGRSIAENGKKSPYAGDIKVDGILKVSSAAGAGVAKIRTVRNLQGKGTTLTGKGKLLIEGLNQTHGNAIFAINEFDRGALSDGFDRKDVPEISLGAIEIIGHGVEGIYNPDGSVDGSPGYRNNANAGFYYVGANGTIDVGSMIVKSTNPGVTADSTVALANFNTAAGILGGKVTKKGPKVKLGEVIIENQAKDDHDGPLSAIYTVQGVIDSTVTGKVSVTAPGGGAAAIVSTGHARWTGPEKTKSVMGDVTVTSKGRNAFFQTNTFGGYGTTVNGNLYVQGYDDGTIAKFVGSVPPGPDMGKAVKLGQAPNAEDVRHEQLLVQGGKLTVTGEVSVENTAKEKPTIIRVNRKARAQLGSLKVNNEQIQPVKNLKKLITSDSKLINKGVLTIEQTK
ncbi:hypothetical protein [Succinivibrio dextrinosolvens]|uniref:hypothetical protein n=1 Tax=Succinivibrio dextrinosolvens TaxID=83771 RepID=UPI0004E215CC|nr:hypothetical protein [Succinivibrio dextrinosolvens]